MNKGARTMEYTKGEWKISRDITLRITSEDRYVCDLASWRLSPEEVKANAHLIAAAPKLLEWIKAKADNGDNDAQCFLATLGF